jgi:hypothetical protein
MIVIIEMMQINLSLATNCIDLRKVCKIQCELKHPRLKGRMWKLLELRYRLYPFLWFLLFCLSYFLSVTEFTRMGLGKLIVTDKSKVIYLYPEDVLLYT